MARLSGPQTQRAQLLSPPRFGIVTVYDGSPKYECAMPLWCTSAKQLSRHVLTTQRPSLTLTLTL